MNEKLSRRRFIQSGSAVYTVSLVSGIMTASVASETFAQTAQPKKIPDRGPRLNLEMVNEFVIAGHSNLDKVKELLTQEPKLINAAWDWGGGDWETALGGASHMGNKEIARFLIENGARMDLFTAAMLGNLDIVKAAIEAFPGNRNVKGPHGITLLAHAKAGKEESVAVAEYLEALK